MLDSILSIDWSWGHVFAAVVGIALYDIFWDAIGDDLSNRWFGQNHVPFRLIGWGLILAILVVLSIKVIYGVLLAVALVLVVGGAFLAARNNTPPAPPAAP